MKGQSYYSNDNGATWVGPLAAEAVEALKKAGIITEQSILKAEPPPAPTPKAAESTAAKEPEKVYYLYLSGETKGPFTVAELRHLVSAHSVTESTLCWNEEIGDWQPVKTALPEILQTQQDAEKLGKLEGFSLSGFFAEVFKRHEMREIEELFCCGTAKTTPPLAEIKTGWPTPWIFTRMLVLCLLLYFGFDWAVETYNNNKLIPGLIFAGNFGIPFCVVILFFELNVRRDVPFTKVSVAMVLGGLISLIVSLFLFRNVNLGSEPYWAGPIEETGKLLAVILIASALRNGRILTGMLLGCAVGAGFAAFESAGYTYDNVIAVVQKGSVIDFLIAMKEPSLAQRAHEVMPDSDPDFVMQLRALITPCGHVVWTAITAGAYWFVQKLKIEAGQRAADNHRMDFSILWDMRFLRIAAIPVALHMTWNSELLWSNLGCWRFAVLGLAAWVVALRLVQVGLKQIKTEQLKQKG